jgi:phage terminase small subunit
VDKLTTKQRLFVEAYLAKPNATEAARRAGYSEKTAYSQGQRLLKNVEIQKMVEGRIEEAGMTADEILNELAAIASGDYTLYRGDKVKSLELLGKYRKLFTDKQEVTGANGGPVEHKVIKIELVDE